MGETPVGVFPGTRTSYLAAFGEVGVDFDFGQPELDLDTRSLFIKETNFSTLLWPVYVLRGDGSVYSVNVPLDKSTNVTCHLFSFGISFLRCRTKATVRGPIPKNISQGDAKEEACAIICVNTSPEVVCVANSNGTIYHSILLPMEEEEREKVRLGESRRRL
jgi:hypothetical protein